MSNKNGVLQIIFREKEKFNSKKVHDVKIVLENFQSQKNTMF